MILAKDKLVKECVITAPTHLNILLMFLNNSPVLLGCHSWGCVCCVVPTTFFCTTITTLVTVLNCDGRINIASAG